MCLLHTIKQLSDTRNAIRVSMLVCFFVCPLICCWLAHSRMPKPFDTRKRSGAWRALGPCRDAAQETSKRYNWRVCVSCRMSVKLCLRVERLLTGLSSRTTRRAARNNIEPRWGCVLINFVHSFICLFDREFTNSLVC